MQNVKCKAPAQQGRNLFHFSFVIFHSRALIRPSP
jgi:hypothetical protein